MTLPISVCPRKDVRLPSGAPAQIRGLTRAEALQARALMPDVQALERFSIGAALGAAEMEITPWYAAASNEDIAFLIDQIAEISGLNVDVGKVVAGGSHSAKSTESNT